MTKNVNQATQASHNDIDDVERTMNYIKFQISTAEKAIDELVAQAKHTSCYAHLLDWRRKLMNELYELRRANKRQK